MRVVFSGCRVAWLSLTGCCRRGVDQLGEQAQEEMENVRQDGEHTFVRRLSW